MKPRLFLLPLFLAAVPARGQSVSWEPATGFVYPAGAPRGTTTEVLVGGRALRSVREVRISGSGVEARVTGTYRSLRQMSGDQRQVLQYLVARRRAELMEEKPPPKPEQLMPGEDGKPKPEAKPPEHPLVDRLPTLSLAELRHWQEFMKRGDRLQPARHLEETVSIEITAAPDAAPGPRELRLIANNGISNPLRFHIGTLPESSELEPNETPETPPLELPCVVNGQIQPGDIDRIRFRAERGQQLVLDGAARSLIPYLADAVPGWFQMVMAVRGPDGREVAHADHFRHDPDPILTFRVPEDGLYTLEVRDSIYRGRDDFVYRIALGELPLVGSRFPLGGRAGRPLKVALRGWNLKGSTLALDTAPGGPPVRRYELPDTRGFDYAVSDLPEVLESEPNHPWPGHPAPLPSTDRTRQAAPSSPDPPPAANPIPFPAIANGRIDPPGDIDIYRVEARAGHPLSVEVVARRLGSPLDAVVHVATGDGQVVAWNDDSMTKDGHLHLDEGLLTHHADPRLTLDPPSDGPLWIRIADTRRAGGPAFAYRLRVAPRQPDFELRVSPSAITSGAGKCTPFSVHVLRRDGFDGEIRLQLADAPQAWKLSGAVIPAGADGVRLTLDLPPKMRPGLFEPKLLGTATLEGGTLTREALPTDDRMQAFLWRHLVPAAEWLVQARGKAAPVARVGDGPIELPAGGSAVVRFRAWKDLAPRIALEPSAAPAGLTVSRPEATRDGFRIEIHAPADLPAGERFNLILDTYPAKNGERIANARFPNNSLPALPVLITPDRTP
ncbi:hypothetical protein [Haloferula sp. A504]|uniref:hypothetical protein n=1 Tax=Haloferula sp. A504 TaxID=3373601 RepID=UPI0031BD0C22|nr:hypothetical protein [Verrucomicrobiaceae bacterium E54]